MAACIALRAGTRSNSALSPEAQFANAQVTRVIENFSGSFALMGPQADLLSDLDLLAAEHSTPGWDGDEAPPVPYMTLQNARSFAAALPSSVPAPELAVDPDDGAISFEWSGQRFNVFSVSIGESVRLSFASVRGSDRLYGAVTFDGGEVPAVILDNIKRFA